MTEPDVRTMRGLPVVREDGTRLAFKNPKSGSDSIHVTRIEEPEEQTTALVNLGTTYSWSVCGVGAASKRKSHAIYLEPDELTREYIERDGDIVGKLCGNCRKNIDPERNPFDKSIYD